VVTEKPTSRVPTTFSHLGGGFTVEPNEVDMGTPGKGPMKTLHQSSTQVPVE
jgi:hypothetical protein